MERSEHWQPQRHNVKRLPHYFKEAALGFLSGVPGWIGDTGNLIMRGADVIPGANLLRNRQPLPDTEYFGGLLNAEMGPAFQLGSIGSPDAGDFGRFAGLLAPTVLHGSPHKFSPTSRNVLGEFDSRKIGTGEGAQAQGYGL